MIDDGLTDEERIRIRDQMSEEERWNLFVARTSRPTSRVRSVGTDDVRPIEARLEQIEKRLETLEMKR